MRYVKKKLEDLTVLSNEQICAGHYRMRLRSEEIIEHINPGQYVHLRIPNTTEPLLRRAFSFAEVGDGWFEVIYQVIGKATTRFSALRPGDILSGLGPLGKGFTVPEELDHALIVGGGVGVACVLLLLRRLAENNTPVTFLLGARDASRLLCEGEIRRTGVDLRIATDDGSVGYHGYVSDLMGEVIEEKGLDGMKTIIFSCGPIPMLRGVAANRHGLPTQVSFESIMGCGLGACLGCVIPVTRIKKYARVCVEGPVFDAEDINWDELR